MSQNTSPPGAITPTIIEVVEPPAAAIDMIQVALVAFELTGYIMGGMAVAGLIAGALFIWYRRRGPASTIEARGFDHNFFRAR